MSAQTLRTATTLFLTTPTTCQHQCRYGGPHGVYVHARIQHHSLCISHSRAALPNAGCVKDSINKTYFDKMSGAPFKANCCSPFHCCGCIELCGEVVAVAPFDGCTNCCCFYCFPCCFTWYPGLANGQAFVDYILVAREDFRKRKSTRTWLSLPWMLYGVTILTPCAPDRHPSYGGLHEQHLRRRQQHVMRCASSKRQLTTKSVNHQLCPSSAVFASRQLF